MSEKEEIEEQMETEYSQDKESMECDNNSNVPEAEKLALNNEVLDADEVLDPALCYLMDQVMSNTLILAEILKRVPFIDRKSAKSVCVLFREELCRKAFQKCEFITIRETFTKEIIETLESLGLLDRTNLNVAFVNVESFKDHPEEFWTKMRWKLQRVKFKGCGLNLELLKLLLKNCYNLRNISTEACFFDDNSGWVKRDLEPERDPLQPLMRSRSTPNPKRAQGKLFFDKNVEEYVRRFVRTSNRMFVYADSGEVQTFVFECNYNNNFIAFKGCNTEDVTIYSCLQLDASPKILPGWSSFHSYLKTKDIDQNSNPRWVMVELSKIEHLALLDSDDPPFIVYMKNSFR